MTGVKFIQQSGNDVLFILDQMTNSGFIDAYKVRDICMIKLMTRQERLDRQPGSPDVKVKSITGQSFFITKSQLAQNYRHISGKKITNAFLKTNTPYTVICNCNEHYKVMKLPDNCVGVFNNTKVERGSYIICKATADGDVDRSTLGIVNGKQFRKMFKIPMQPVIQRNMNGKSNKRFGLFDKRNARAQRISRPSISMPMMNNRQPVMNNAQPVINNAVNQNIQNSRPVRPQVQANQQVQQEVSKYRFTATHKLVKASAPDKIVGYAIKDLRTGQSTQLSIPQVAKLCDKKLVDNIVKVDDKSKGAWFLRGNGIALGSLQTIIIEV